MGLNPYGPSVATFSYASLYPINTTEHNFKKFENLLAYGKEFSISENNLYNLQRIMKCVIKRTLTLNG